jgi:hypothetical protein
LRAAMVFLASLRGHGADVRGLLDRLANSVRPEA